MSLGMHELRFTVAQMEDVIVMAHSMALHFPMSLTPAEVAVIVSEATDVPINDVADALQRLAEYREAKHG